MKKEKRGLNITIHLTNRWLYALITIGILSIIGVGVYAYGTSSPSTFGHSSGEVDVTIGTTTKTLQEAIDAGDLSISTNPLYVEGAITAPEGTLRDDGGGWIRTYGNTGWYSQSHGGGWYMSDANWIRSYGSKNVYVNTLLRADGGLNVGDDEGFYRGGEDVIRTGDSLVIDNDLRVSNNVHGPSASFVPGLADTYDQDIYNGVWECAEGAYVAGIILDGCGIGDNCEVDSIICRYL